MVFRRFVFMLFAIWGTAIIGWVLLSPSPTRSQGTGVDVMVNIRARGEQKLNIAIPTFTATGADPEGLARRVPEIIGRDLTFSNLFTVVTNASPLPAKDPAALKKNLADFAGAGAHAALQGLLSIRGDQAEVEVRLYDLTSPDQRVIASTKWSAKMNNQRRLAHRIADDVVLQFTGERGTADTKIAFVGKVSGTKEIYMMDYDGEDLVRLTTTQSTNLFPVWNPDSRSIAFTSYMRGYPFLYRLFPFERRPFQLLAGWPGLNSSPAWNPDGKSLLVTLSKDGNPELYLLPVGSDTARRLTTHWGIDTDPSWSPTGREIAFVSERAGSPQVFVMDAEGANVRRVTYEGSYNTQPRWAPKGDMLAYTSRQGGFDIWAVNADGSSPRRLTAGQGSNQSPSWAPNGRHLVLASNRNGRWQLFTMLADGSAQTLLPTGSIEATSPSWSPRLP
jgi:TolB protein